MKKSKITVLFALLLCVILLVCTSCGQKENNTSDITSDQIGDSIVTSDDSDTTDSGENTDSQTENTDSQGEQSADSQSSNSGSTVTNSTGDSGNKTTTNKGGLNTTSKAPISVAPSELSNMPWLKAPRQNFFGIAPRSIDIDNLQITLLTQLGAKHARVSLSVDNMGYNPDDPDYMIYTNAINALSSAGISSMVLITDAFYKADFTVQGDRNVINSDQAVKAANRCVNAIRELSKIGVTDFEIGDECNMPYRYWNPADYGTFITKIYEGVKAAKLNVRIAAGSVRFEYKDSVAAYKSAGYNTDSMKWLTDFYNSAAVKGYRAANGGKPPFDAIGIKPMNTVMYSQAGKTYNDKLKKTIDAVSALMDGCGDPYVPIWITALGVNEPNDTVQANAAADYINQIGNMKRVEYLYWYSILADENWSITTDYAGTKRASFTRIASEIAALANVKFK